MDILGEMGYYCGRFILASAFLMLIYWLLLRKTAGYAFLRAYLLALPLISLFLAFLMIEVGDNVQQVVYVDSYTHGVPAAGTTDHALFKGGVLRPVTEETFHFPLKEVLLVVYSVVATLLMLHLLYGAFCIWGKRVKSSVVRFGKFRIYRSADISSPFSFVNAVFLPQHMSGKHRFFIMKHELAHIRCRHYYDIFYIETVTRMLWFNPVLWAVLVELRNIHEFQADARVLQTGGDLHVYQTLLLEEALSVRYGLTNGFGHSFIRRRFILMKQNASRHLGKLRAAVSVGLFAVFFSVFCFAKAEAEVVYRLRQSSVSAVDKMNVSRPVVEVADSSDVVSSGDAFSVKSVDSVKVVGNQPLAYDKPDTSSLAVTSQDVSAVGNNSAIQGISADTQVHHQTEHTVFEPLNDNISDDDIPVKTHAKGALPSSESSGSIQAEFLSMKVPFYIIREKKETQLVLLSYVQSDSPTYFFSSNIFIVDKDTGDKYKVRRIEGGYNLDERFRLRHYKNNVIEFTLIFPPLPKSVNRIDVIESGTTERWNYFNIKLKDIERERINVIL